MQIYLELGSFTNELKILFELGSATKQTELTQALNEPDPEMLVSNSFLCSLLLRGCKHCEQQRDSK